MVGAVEIFVRRNICYRRAWDEELLRIEIESLQGADFDVSCRASVMKGQGGYLSGFEV